MKYEDRIVCFLDILGFSEIVNNSSADQSVSTQSVASIHAALSSIRDVLDIDRTPLVESRHVTQFSDSVVLSFKIGEQSGVFWSLLDILWVQIHLISHGFVCRGGVARGELIHDDFYLYGPALIQAYELESRRAVNPRVILDESVIDVGGTHHSYHHTKKMETKSILELVDRDSDGYYYINYFENAEGELNDPYYDFPVYLHALAKIIGHGLVHEDKRVRKKYEWMRERYDPLVEGIQDHLQQANLDPEVYEAYETLPIFA